MRPTAWPLLVLALLLAPSESEAQGFLGLEATVGYAGWSSDDFEGFQAGPRFQLGLFAKSRPSLAFGVTGTLGLVDLQDLEGDVTELGLAGTLRRSVGSPDGTHLCLLARAGWSRLAVDIPTATFDLTTDGFSVGPGAALSFPLGSGLHASFGGDLEWHSYRDLRLEFGSNGTDAGASGWRWNARAGLSLGVGP
ncbi:MAG: hypothetical protein PVI57_05825 [Gemmatimonadota bacterium]|jgi:hypothetical protein